MSNYEVKYSALNDTSVNVNAINKNVTHVQQNISIIRSTLARQNVGMLTYAYNLKGIVNDIVDCSICI